MKQQQEKLVTYKVGLGEKIIESEVLIENGSHVSIYGKKEVLFLDFLRPVPIINWKTEREIPTISIPESQIICIE